MVETHDVIVIGSGAAGLVAALRARDLGLDVLVVEKAHKWGGTSATSGGVLWIPNNKLGNTTDTREESLKYLNAVVKGPINRERLEAFVDTGHEAIAYLRSLGIEFVSMPWPDYFSNMPGARNDRSLVLPKYDGRRLGDQFPLMREQYERFKLFNRYAMDLYETFTIAARGPGWIKALFRVIGRYWADLGTRMITRRDRWFTSGAAYMGPLRERLIAKGVEVRLGTKLEKFVRKDGRVCGIEVSNYGRRYELAARHGVVIAAGGFEWNQELRNKYFTVPGSIYWSSTPQGANTGDALIAALDLGAATEFTEQPWFAPTMIMPNRRESNFEATHQAVFDVGRPGSVCVNRNCDRFVDESCSYDLFGIGMMEDHLKTGANMPCWLVFDKTFRDKFTAGGFLPHAIMTDSSIPVDWWDHYIFKSDTVAGLAKKINLDPAKLEKVVERMNAYAAKGEDPEFGRGGSEYDRVFGDPTVKPNPCLGPISTPPYYAVPINGGDLGTKGGLKADAKARVLDTSDRPIPGLYAAGNATGSPFGSCYPGAGGTIGPATVFGYIAANDIAANARGGAVADSRPKAVAAP